MIYLNRFQKIFWLSAFGFWLNATVAFAEFPSHLLGQTERPTMQQIDQYEDDISGEPNIPLANFNWPAWEEILRSEGPKLIANLEMAFPGATWAFLGRDTRIIGEMVEAFYLGHGQKNRVVYISGSKPSYVDANGQQLWQTNPNLLMSFLESSGFSLADVQRSGKPFILIDTVSSGNGRQGRALLHVIYSAHHHQGGDVANLARKVNMIGLVVSTFRGTYNPIYDHALTVDATANQYRRGETNYFEVHQFPMFRDESNQKFNEIGYTHYTGQWHDTFGALQSHGRRVYSPPGTASDVNTRKSILWMQKRILEIAQSSSFLNAVKAQARLLGYEFATKVRSEPISSPVPPPDPVLSNDEEKWMQDFRNQLNTHDTWLQTQIDILNIVSAKFSDFIGRTPESESVEDGLTDGATDMMALVRLLLVNYPSEIVGLCLLEATVSAHPKDIVRRRDLKFLLEKSLSLALPSTRFIQALGDLAAQSDGFKNNRIKDESWLSDSKARRNLQQINDFLQQSPSDCQNIFGAY